MKFWTLHEAITYGRGEERPFLCPVHGDSRPSASVNVVKKKWICYTCGARGGLTGEDALIEPDYDVMQQWFEAKLEEQRVYSESWLVRYTAGDVHPYWTKRVGNDAAKHFKLGWDSESDSVTYPLRDQGGRVLGVVRRSLASGADDGRRSGPKYLYPRGVDVGRLLFNYTPEKRRVVYLCEGALDAVALHNVGVHAFAIYGARLGAEQIKLIDRVDPEIVVCAYDNDDAGSRAAWDTEKAFKHRAVTRLTWPRGWGKDVDEIGETRLRKVVDDLALDEVSCVGSSTWQPPKIVRSCSGSSSPRRKLRIVRTAS